MSFYTSLSGLRGAQTDLATISNNVANANSVGFKRSRAMFGDLFASSPTQSTRSVAGQGTRLIGIAQQFGQGTLEATDRTLDLAIAGDGFFTVRGDPPQGITSYTRNGSFAMTADRTVVDTIGARVQLLPVDADGTVTSRDAGAMFDFVVPAADPADPLSPVTNLSVSEGGVVTATFANGNQMALGALALASFPAVDGLRPMGDAHWQSTGLSGRAMLDQAANGPLGTIRAGTLERANVDLTEELVGLISAQRNFQANAQAIETAGSMTQTIINLQI